MMGTLANSTAAPANLSTSDEDSTRLGFESGESPFMVNYTFAYGSAGENAPDIQKNMGFARYPRTVASEPSKPPLGGFNIGVSEFSEEPELAFEAATCINSDAEPADRDRAGWPAADAQHAVHGQGGAGGLPGFAPLIQESIEAAGVRPLTPAYTDVSLAVQRTLHPPDKINPDDVGSIYEELRDNVEKAVKREGLL